MQRIRLKTAVSVLIICAVLFVGFLVYDAYRNRGHEPEIYCDDDYISCSISDDSSVLLNGVYAEDAEDGDLTGSIIVESISKFYEKGRSIVTYAVCDSDGNVAKHTRMLTYTDYTSPVFSLSQNLTFGYGYTFDLKNYITATDCIQGDISNRIKTVLVGDVSSVYNVGVWTVRAKVTNDLGDTSSIDLTVTVTNNDQTIPTVKLKQYIVYMDKGKTFNPTDFIESVDFDGVTYTDRELLDTVVVRNNVDVSTPGEYTVEYAYTVAGGSTGKASMTVIVNPDKDGSADGGQNDTALSGTDSVGGAI